jgi:cytochrome c-type biogenesis protein CcmH
MTFWIIVALMTAAAVCAVMWPLARRPKAVVTGNDLAVYRDQLEEIDRDRLDGTIGAPEAEAARVEVSRRLLAAAEAEAAEKSAAQVRPRRRVAVVTAGVLLPLLGIALYARLGSPGLPGQPFAERLAAIHAGQTMPPSGEDAALANLVARVEAHLAENPNDGRGWQVIAPAYMRLNRYGDAVDAHRKAIRLLGATEEREAELGEAMVAANDGRVTGEAKAIFERLTAKNTDNVIANFYLGIAAKQSGNLAEAARIWEGAIARAPADADWIPFFRKALERLNDGEAPPAAKEADLSPPEELPTEQREMARGMVERLAARLQSDGSDVEGWLRLIRSYMVMADRDAARSAAADARRALASDATRLQRLDEGVRQLGLDSSGAFSPTRTQVPAVAAAPVQRPAATMPPTTTPPAAEIDPSQRDMVLGMVDRLASRLRENGSDVEGWIRLVRSYVVLGDRDKARAAAADARKALSGEPDKLRLIEGSLKELGLEG